MSTPKTMGTMTNAPRRIRNACRVGSLPSGTPGLDVDAAPRAVLAAAGVPRLDGVSMVAMGPPGSLVASLVASGHRGEPVGWDAGTVLVTPRLHALTSTPSVGKTGAAADSEHCMTTQPTATP